MLNSTSIISALPELPSYVRNVHDVVGLAEICWLMGSSNDQIPKIGRWGVQTCLCNWCADAVIAVVTVQFAGGSCTTGDSEKCLFLISSINIIWSLHVF